MSDAILDDEPLPDDLDGGAESDTEWEPVTLGERPPLDDEMVHADD